MGDAFPTRCVTDNRSFLRVTRFNYPRHPRTRKNYQVWSNEDSSPKSRSPPRPSPRPSLVFPCSLSTLASCTPPAGQRSPPPRFLHRHCLYSAAATSHLPPPLPPPLLLHLPLPQPRRLHGWIWWGGSPPESKRWARPSYDLVRWRLEQIEALADGGSSEAGDSASPHSSVPQISLAGTLMTPQAVLLEWRRCSAGWE